MNCHTGGDGTPGAVDVKADILFRVLAFQIQKLCNNYAGGSVAYLFRQHDNAVIQQARKNIIRPLAAACLFNNIRD
ncbi:hypothetical protein SDC9_96982 [bioreactor metagenome]|uniref:Uncharacterized protein n=1 Tax=bioreactor metagenome TaxID=1076179 RepID=A0A645ABG2_9ZZZZ